MNCPHCGVEVEPGSTVCPNCHADWGSVESPASFSAPEPASAQASAAPAKSKKPLVLGVVGAAVVVMLVVAFALVVPEMNRAAAYGSAENLLAQGSYEEAKAAYLDLGDYRDAPAQAGMAQKHLAYESAKSLMDGGSYEEAIAEFEQLGSFQDAAVLSGDCRNKMLIDEAGRLLAEGKNYEAYQTYMKVQPVDEVADLAAACAVSTPATGVLYANPAYSGVSDCALTLSTAAPLSGTCLVKLNRGDETVATVFFAEADQEVRVELPAGSYTLKAAMGTTWFGEENLYGDKGTYNVVSVNGSNDVALDAGYEYSIGLETSFLALGRTDLSSF